MITHVFSHDISHVKKKGKNRKWFPGTATRVENISINIISIAIRNFNTIYNLLYSAVSIRFNIYNFIW